MMFDATQNYARVLTKMRLYDWQASLAPPGPRIAVGAWRDKSSGPMQVASGPYRREGVHIEAPNAGQLPEEVTTFLAWLEGERGVDPVLKAAVAHLWFVTVPPLEDGNGRTARAIADLALRGINDLVSRDILAKDEGRGQGTSCSLREPTSGS